MLRMLLSWIVVLVLFSLVAAIYVRQYYPCQTKLYSIGPVDPRFGFTEKEFEKATDTAANTWNTAIGLELFAKTDRGGMVVSAVYDGRQQARNKLKELDTRLSAGRQSFQALKKQYDNLLEQYNAAHAEYTELRASYEALKNSFESDMETAKANGMTKGDSQRLLRMQQKINDLADQANRKQEATKELANTINRIVGELKKSADEGQASIGQVAEVDATLGDEFEQGVHETDAMGERITVFSFENPPELIQLLTHEFGHAVGIGHLSDTGAIMYYLNYTGRAQLNASDLSALQEQCQTPPERLLEWLMAKINHAPTTTPIR